MCLFYNLHGLHLNMNMLSDNIYNKKLHTIVYIYIFLNHYDKLPIMYRKISYMIYYLYSKSNIQY